MRSVATALTDHVAIISWGWLCILANQYSGRSFFLPLYLLALVRIAYHLRGLECLTHEGSHWNWSRAHTGLNDFFTNLLAAIPVGSCVTAFRRSHELHHPSHRFGGDADPDHIRYRKHRLHNLNRCRPLLFVGRLLGQLLPYQIHWWSTIGANFTTLLRTILWHVSFVILPLTLAVDSTFAVRVWVMFFAVPFFIVLPVLRFVGEAAEHRFSEGGSVFASTISNIGLIHRWFIHPHGDGYHLLHHLFPCIPHYRLKLAHRLLSSLDPTRYGDAPIRTRVFSEP